MAEETKVAPPVLHNMDIGTLLVEDCASFEKLTDSEHMKRTQKNVCGLYNQLFELKKK